ncbi:MAG: hypothetical protein E6Q97_37785 [Desulfurellales bacterium]|nr:MAG: hypothetical protein E6Q97_37785 [Desulfurellales bacterium]
MSSLTSDEMVKARARVASLQPWRGPESLAEIVGLLAEGEHIRGQASSRGEWFDGRLANEIGFWRRVPGAPGYEPSTRKACTACRPQCFACAESDVPSDREKAWKLAELRFLVRHEAVQFGLTKVVDKRSSIGTKLIEILWPNHRCVPIDQIQRWASDDLNNEEGRQVEDWRTIPPAFAIAIVHHHGNATVARGHGYTLPDYSPGDNIPGVTFTPMSSEDT